ncbi:hypothetical protein L3X38_025853 [Prunus dulcis]|uniref:Uncharacterized protein n=1 Tax=Prunus dulcis TaxID=3755 RepID=A0AAD4W441_PRUDU|nr:hypothetical protein L3X38_025853 [Prunus dulcis]
MDSPLVDATIPPPPTRPHEHQVLHQNLDFGSARHAKRFNGRGDPTLFVDWISAMEDYFEWYDMSDAQRIRKSWQSQFLVSFMAFRLTLNARSACHVRMCYKMPTAKPWKLRHICDHNGNTQDILVSVMRCIYCALAPPDSWKCISIFHTYVPCNNQTCKLVIDGGSTMNVISKSAVTRLNLKLEPHPHPFHVAWVDKTKLPVIEWCLVPLKLGTYEEDIYLDLLPMNIAHVLLGRPWLYDHRVQNCGRKNTYTFQHEGKSITLRPANPAIKPTKTNVTPSPLSQKDNTLGHRLALLSYGDFEKESRETGMVFALMIKEIYVAPSYKKCEPLHQLLNEFSGVMPVDLPDELPSMRDIQHAIDLVPGSQLPNLPHYHMNSSERAELNTQIQGSKWFSKIHLRRDYHQIRIREGDEWKTAFKFSDIYKHNMECLGFLTSMDDLQSSYIYSRAHAKTQSKHTF